MQIEQEDYFIPRLGNLLDLLIPFAVEDFYLRNLSIFIKIWILALWIGGIIRLVKSEKFFDKPKIEGFGRDIVYL
jgi:hypothetical protein